MLKVTREYTRPSTNIPWHGDVLPSTDFMNKIYLYMSLDKHISYIITYSDDLLIMKYEGYWINRETFDEYDVDPDLTPYWELRNEYYKSVGVIIGPLIVEEI